MKTKIVFGLLAFLLVIFIILLFIPENKTFKIISSPKVFSILKSSDNETFTIQFLVNKNNTYYFDEDFISSASLNSELDEEIIPLIIKEISYDSMIYEYEKDKYYIVEIKLEVGFNSDDFLIEFEKAYLELNYSNNEDLKLYIGEFNYYFNEDINTELSLNNLYSTVKEIDGVNTVTGVYIKLNNISDENLVITNFNLGSNSVYFNNFYLSEIFVEPDLFDDVEDVLVLQDYNFNIYTTGIYQSILLRENQSVMIYVPLSYIGDINYIHRFYIEIEYENEAGVSKLVIDDFPFINTSIFQDSLEDEYVTYEIPN